MLATENQRVPDVNDALRAAAKKGCLAAVRFLLEEGVDINNADKNDRDMTALHIAAREGHVEVLQYLVKQGANIERNDSCGWTALMWAAIMGQLEVLRYLVEQGAKKERPCNNGTTALMWAAYKGHFGVVEFLLEDGINVNKVSPDGGDTALHWAAQKGRAEVVSILMAYGASLTARTTHGELPIDMAANEAIRVLIHDEPSRRMDHGHKRAVIPDPERGQSSASASASATVTLTAEELKYEEDVNGDSTSSDEDICWVSDLISMIKSEEEATILEQVSTVPQ